MGSSNPDVYATLYLSLVRNPLARTGFSIKRFQNSDADPQIYVTPVVLIDDLPRDGPDGPPSGVVIAPLRAIGVVGEHQVRKYQRP